MKTTILLVIWVAAFIVSVAMNSPGFFLGFMVGGAVASLDHRAA